MTIGKVFISFCFVISAQLSAAMAQILSFEAEIVLVPNVGGTWQTINLVNSYSSPVVVCTYNLPSRASNSAITRVRNAGATSFELRVQQFEDSAAVTPSDVHCLIVDEGVHTFDNGQKIEAHTVLSDSTSGDTLTWSASNTENVTSMLGHTYSSLIVFGQVMTFNDNRASSFWTNDCTNRQNEPTISAICVGKHIGEIDASRANETLGFIVTEPGSGAINEVDYIFAHGTDTVRGVGNGPPYSYSVAGDFDIGIAQSASMDGAHGGWAVLYGADPLSSGIIELAIEEETVAGDTQRIHTSEEVFYAVFADNQGANLRATKTVDVFPGSGTGYAIPGTDVIYTIGVESLGASPVDSNSVFLVDSLPAEVTFFNGDIDDGGPETGPIAFNAMSSGLTLLAADIRYSNVTSAPANFASCTYTPTAGYDGNVRHICFNPKGVLKAGSLETDTDFEISFRVQIK